MYNIIFCVNEKFFKKLPLVIYSLCKHSTKEVKFHVFYSSKDEKTEKEIIKILDYFKNRCKLRIQLLDSKVRFDNLNIKVPAWNGGFDAYSRAFVVDELQQEKINKAVYLDADILVLSDLDDLLTYCDSVKGIIGLIAEPSDNFILRDTGHRYVNSGVLIMNLNYLRKIDFVTKFINVFKTTNPDFLKFPDQDAINMIVDNDYIDGFDYKYNTFSVTYKKGMDCVILHYAGPKPWQFWRKWNHAKFIYYRELSKYKLVMIGFNNIDKLVDNCFSILEVIAYPLVWVLNMAHDLNHLRRIKRHNKNKNK